MTTDLHHPRSIRPRLRALSLGALALATVAFDRGACDRPERLYVERPATWFEDISTSAQISADGRWALIGRFGVPKLIDLQTGQEDQARLRAGLDEVSFAVFRGEALVRLGRRGDVRSWFVEESGGPRPVNVPVDATPRWSPKDDRVAFRRRGVAAVFVGPLESPTRYEVSGRITGLAWSADGRFLYVVVWDNTRGLSSLLRLAEGSSELQPVAQGLDAEPFDSALASSPDGRRIYLALASAGDQPPGAARHQPDADRDLDIYEIDVATGARRPVVQGPGDDFAPVVAGGRLHYTHNDIHESVVVIPAAGGPARLVVEGGGIPSWASDGRQIAFTRGGWRRADWALNLDAAVVDIDEQARPTSGPRAIVTGYHEDFTPAWSPNGRWLAYHSHRSPTPVASYDSSGSTDDVYLRSAAPGSPEIRLTDFGLEVGWADWAPDGRRLVFSSWDRGGTPPGVGLPWIVTIDPQTGAPTGVARLPLPAPIQNAEWLAWSPAGDEIALDEKTSPNRHALWRVAADGSTAQRLVEYTAETYGGLDWSPDGKTLVYAAREGERLQLFAIPPSGPPRRLSDDSANLLHPQVSPDGAWIASSRFQVTKEIRRTNLP